MDDLNSFLIHDFIFGLNIKGMSMVNRNGKLMSRKTLSWWRYNPIMNKPTSLDPVRPFSSFWYYGPDPAAGVSYGQYHDPKNKFDIVTKKPDSEDQVVYSPATSEPMEYVSDVSYAELNDIMSKSTSSVNTGANCEACAVDLVSDFDLSLPDQVFCPGCGGGVKVTKNGTENSETKTKEKTMSRVSEARVNNLKTRIRASILKKRKVEAVKAGAKKRPAKTRKSLRRVKADEEMISLDTIMEAMENEIEDEAMEEDEEEVVEEAVEAEEGMEEEVEEEAPEEESYMEEELEEDSEMGSYMADEDMEEEAMEEESYMDDAPEEEEIVEDEAAMDMEMGGEEDEEAGDDEYMDLDMVISMIEKKERIAKAKKKSKIKALAKRKALAKKKALAAKRRRIKADEGEAGEEEDLEEALMEEVEEEVEEDTAEAAEDGEDAGAPDETPDSSDDELDEDLDTGSSSPEPDMVSEENPTADEEAEESAAMKFEPLAAVSNLKDVKKESIDLALYGEDTDNPTWNVTIAGIPAARIQLKKQLAPEEIRSAFCSDDYAKDLIIHCEKTGFVKTMANVRAEFWTNFTSNQKVAARYKKAAEKEFKSEKQKMVASFRDNFRSCLNIVSAGLTKNFYPELGNALKDSMFTNLKTVGLPENTAVSAIEKSFQESAGEYFNSLFNKAEEYMDLAPQARTEISAAISNGSSLNHYNSEGLDKAAPATLSDRVSQASVVPESVGTHSNPLKVSAELTLDTENYKRQLKSVFHKR